MTLQPGTRLGSCEIVSLLGAGGMGEVYRARDARLGRDVAIKVLPPSFAADADRLARFEQEARAAGALNHPNLVTVHELGRHDGQVFIVSELLEGESLRERLSSGALSVARATDYATQIANGLAAAHEKGIVHRDLKPENIFITSDGRVKILDFGLAKLSIADSASSNLPTANVKTDPGTVMGTVGYMSPEQVRGQAVDHRSDIFSFGAVLYEMLSGRRAFRGDSSADTMSAVLREDPPEISQSGRIVPPALERIVHHCLEKSPAQRFQSARDLAFDLQSMSTTSGVQPPVRSHIWRPLAMALALIAVTLAAGLLIARYRKPASSPAYKSLTFRRGGVSEARFTPDGQSIVYSATWEGQPFRTFMQPVSSAYARDLGLADDMTLRSVSATGELAMLKSGRLSRVPSSGGAPRDVASLIGAAAWTPDGELVVERFKGEQMQLEFPIDHPVYRITFSSSNLAVSRDGQLAAIFECHTFTGPCDVSVIDRKGARRVLVDGLSQPEGGIAFSADGKEIWYASGQALFAANMRGGVRKLLEMPDNLYLQDIAANGDVLLELIEARVGTILSRPGEHDRDLSWLDGTWTEDVTADGKKVLFSEEGSGESNPSTYLRDTDGSPPIRLADGYAERLSPNGEMALVYSGGKNPRQVIVPTGAGTTTTLPVPPGVTDYDGIDWFADSRRVIYSAKESSGHSRIYVQSIDSTTATPITPSGISFPVMCKCLSPDGQWVAGWNDQNLMLFPVAGGVPRPLPNIRGIAQTRPMQWTSDGKKLIVYEQGPLPRQIDLYDIATAKRTPLATFNLSDPAGYRGLQRVRVSADLKTFVYTYRRILSRLVLVRGLR